ncbi:MULTISPECIES: outer membrane protein assembly factor BamC [unclassified Neisseria]|uniref:outer membrane protein assembly factor BamC n=1 Tax=unclassified Neisseria TaxID=2623750 RepID=UPI0026656BAD|nr:MULTISPECIES: outer membrane protein assembly factor BamC [unclassified Neisseria]MDO1510156.1 outer membrane protein assembly factor BamC [Neisseria sp. MVDL19-042950]MDO1516732.1 outer membrane protein assembly factor BamC [Neisseria sp. MVDL18-041461]MDO1563879.1 outer membrane protein assembly factor BamC [Neisseria sp. MVDL20-010259]
MNRMKPVVLAVTLIGLAACSSNKEQPRLDYQTKNRKVVNLEVPPDLTNPDQGNRYQIPAGSGAVRASDLNRNKAVQQPANQAVLQSVKGVRLERDGSQRWLVVEGKEPAEIWPLLKVFWQENGFDIKSEEPAIGQMETEWAENRAKIPQDSLRRLFEKVGLGGVYSTSERDKFIIRIEQGKSGTTDVFFAHKGMKEVYGDKNKDTTLWQPRPNDPNLEAAFLARFMQYLGVDAKQAESALGKSVAATRSGSDLAKLEGNSVVLRGDYDRNWRRTALALDRIGLTVIGQNTQRHAFLVQPAPQEGEAVSTKKPSLLKRIFGKGKNQASATAAPELIVYVEPIANGTRLRLLNKDGSAYQGKDASTWLSRLHTELR